HRAIEAVNGGGRAYGPARGKPRRELDENVDRGKAECRRRQCWEPSWQRRANRGRQHERGGRRQERLAESKECDGSVTAPRQRQGRDGHEGCGNEPGGSSYQ